LQAVQIIKPKLVVPCHYNCLAFFSKKYNPADDKTFKKDVEEMEIKYTDSLKIFYAKT